jgi:hypothetical protein
MPSEHEPTILDRWNYSGQPSTASYNHAVEVANANHAAWKRLEALANRQQQEQHELRRAIRNVRLSAASARTFGHSGTPTLEAQVAKKNEKLDHILRFCAEVGETGNILRGDAAPSAQLILRLAPQRNNPRYANSAGNRCRRARRCSITTATQGRVRRLSYRKRMTR